MARSPFFPGATAVQPDATLNLASTASCLTSASALMEKHTVEKVVIHANRE